MISTIEEAREAHASGTAGRLAVTRQAKEEHQARKAALAAGSAPPATPALDFINLRESEPEAKRPQRTVMYTINSKPLGDRYNSLSWAAVRAQRMPAADLRAFLASQGITEPDTTEWEVELPSGYKVGTVRLDAAPVRPTKASRATTKAEPATPGKAEPVPAKRRGAKAAPAKKAATPRKRATKVA